MNPPFQHRLAHMRAVLVQRQYSFIAVLAALVYVGFSASTVLYIHGTLGSFYNGMYASYTIPFTVFTIVLSVLFGLNVAMFVAKLKEIRLKSAGLGVTGILFGSLAAGCPGCFFGLFPLVLSMFGISATLAILPFNGLEFEVIAIIALCLSLVTLAKETDVACKIR